MLKYTVLLSFLSLSAPAFAVDDYVQAKRGATPVSYDSRGNAIYKLTDIESRFDQGYPSPMVYKGTKSIEGEFPEVGFLGFCTATAVGPNIIYTAAHCVSNGQKVNWKMRSNQVSYSGVCNRHPQYNDRTVFNDYAFCILDKSLPAETVYASFDLVGVPDSDWEFLLNGFGAPYLGNHYWGKAGYSKTSGQDIITCGPANLGGGDSGGAFFKWSTDRRDVATHQIIGTNSRAGGGCSYFNRVNHANFKPYALTVSKKAGTYICGVDKDCLKPVDPNKCLEERSFVETIKKELGLAEDALKLCMAE
jgi:hypothetical protein